jgi:hypothetical protein
VRGGERPLTEADVSAFIMRGFVKVEHAFSREVADQCRGLLWEQLGLSPDEPLGWTRPVIRLGSQDAEPCRRAGHTPRLDGALDQLVGEGRWVGQDGVGGTTVVRFPVEGDPGDDGWHIDGSFEQDGSYWVNVRSDGRSLLMLSSSRTWTSTTLRRGSASALIWTSRLRWLMPDTPACRSRT